MVLTVCFVCIQGQLVMLNQYTVSMYYSTPKTGPGAPAVPESARNAQDNWSRTDWICNKVCTI